MVDEGTLELYRRTMEHIAVDVAIDGYNAFMAMTICIMNMG